jgi:hypothetical protein
MLSGFLFLFIIIVLTIAGERFGNEVISDLDSDAKLQEIANDPKKFKIGFVLVLIENVSIISLAVMLFVAFSPYNISLELFGPSHEPEKA